MVQEQSKTRILLKSKALHQQGSTQYSISIREQLSPAFSFINKLEEVTLGAARSYNYEALAPSLVIPLVGSVMVNEQTVNAGQFIRTSSSQMKIRNPFRKSNIDFLNLSFQREQTTKKRVEEVFAGESNQLHPLLISGNLKVSIGRFSGRFDAEYKTHSPDSLVLAYIIEGAFEMQNCLLEKGDALEISHSEQLDFEALSNNAILLLVEHA